MSVTEETDVHSRVLKRHYIEVNDAKWEVSTILLPTDPHDLIEEFIKMVDLVDDVSERYETMIFKIVDDMRYSASGLSFGATSFGHYRSNDSEDIVKAHDQIVALIAEGKLTPVFDRASQNETVSTNILKVMMGKTPGSIPASGSNR